MINSISFGWIDYSSEDRNKVMSVLHSLSSPEAVDELGIGSIRDGFADILFPGTSTVQTRAKYFLIVPYILMELEKETNLTVQRFLDKFDAIEKQLIDILSKDDAEGVIGKRAKGSLKRKPSSIYWNGLRTLEIFKYPKLTITEYVKAMISLKSRKVEIKKGVSTENESFDDDDAVRGEIIGEFWRCIPPKKDWKDDVSINLTKKEAEYLVDRIAKSSRTRDTLFGYIVKNNIKEILEVDDFNCIGEVISLPAGIREDYEMAKEFSQFIYGANLRYNYILYNGDNEWINKEWDIWVESPFVKNKFNDYNVDLVLSRLAISNIKLRNFLKGWKEAYISGDIVKIDNLIINREKQIKSIDRCKLNNPNNFNTEEGRTRGGKLEYRFTIGKKHICDIFQALGDEQND